MGYITTFTVTDTLFHFWISRHSSLTSTASICVVDHCLARL